MAVAAGVPGRWTLRLEPLSRLKCIHVSGPSKWWVQAGLADGSVREHGNDVCGPTVGPGYIELTRQHYEREQRLKDAFWRLVPGQSSSGS